MTDFLDIDFSEINSLGAQLANVPEFAGRHIRSAIEVTSRKIKDDWAEKLKGEPHAPHASRSITYDISTFSGFGGSVIQSEIGAERGRTQAPIVTVIEFGSPVNNTQPHGYGAGALIQNADDFEEGLLLATKQAEAEALGSGGTTKIAASVLKGR